MACACKRKLELENEYGVDEKEGIFKKALRILFKVSVMLLAIVATLVVSPVLVIVSFYKIFFGNNNITLPNFLGKYLRKTDG